MIDIYDIHSHVLPAIDDGAKNWDMSLEMILESWNHGVRKVVATPHFLPWKPEIELYQIHELCKELTDKVNHELGIPMEIYPGQEIYYHYDIVENLNNGKIQTMADSRYLLIEFEEAISFKEILLGIKKLRKARYLPVLAHVERYACLRKENRLEELKNAGAYLQMNSESLVGNIFNEDCRWCRKKMLTQKIDFIGSDMHNISNRPPISTKALEWMQDKLDNEYSALVLSANCDFLRL